MWQGLAQLFFPPSKTIHYELAKEEMGLHSRNKKEATRNLHDNLERLCWFYDRVSAGIALEVHVQTNGKKYAKEQDLCDHPVYMEVINGIDIVQTDAKLLGMSKLGKELQQKRAESSLLRSVSDLRAYCLGLAGIARLYMNGTKQPQTLNTVE